MIPLSVILLQLVSAVVNLNTGSMMYTSKIRHMLPVRGYKTLTSTENLAKALSNKASNNIVVLDCAFSAVPEEAYTTKYLESHIPGAKFFNHHSCVTSTSLVPRAIPEPYCFTKKLRQLGVSTSTDVVVYDRKVSSSYAARVWWLLRLFGHEKVSILDGGLMKWVAEGRRTKPDVSTKTAPGDFNINFRTNLIHDAADVRQIVTDKSAQIVDGRGQQYFSGAMPHSENLTGGHIPGSINTPNSEFYNQDGTFKTPAEIEEVFQRAGVNLSRPLVTSCRTGVNACTLAAAAHILGKTNTPVYYGSWMEWAQTETDLIAKSTDRSQG